MPRDGAPGLDPEKVAYWYFRLNGFLQIENFVVHPIGGGGQRTDADLLAVRFPYRAERLYDDRNDIMRDDEHVLSLSGDCIDVVIAEVKTNQPCTLNGPWTQQDRQNIHRVLSAIGCLPHDRIEVAAADIYRNGMHQSEIGVRIRLIALGRERSDSLASNHPQVVQLIWSELLDFMWRRFRAYRRQKRQVDQWDEPGRLIKDLADRAGRSQSFIDTALARMGVATTTSPTTAPGFINRNGQRVVRRAELPGTDHLQMTYELRCDRCQGTYGANGSDIWLRRCPHCQMGAPGLPLPA